MNDTHDESAQQTEETEQRSEDEPIEWKDFLESFPVDTVQLVKNCWGKRKGYGGSSLPYFRKAPRLKLYCDKCEGYRFFDGAWLYKRNFSRADTIEDFLIYTCRDCSEGKKTYCLMHAVAEHYMGHAIKIAEYPDLYIEIPKSLRKLIGDDYSLLLKGLKCEKLGLGIGAFTYYRRVVESQKTNLIGEMLKVAKKLRSPQEVITKLTQAYKEIQFTRALELMGKAIPESLLVDSHNPLKLLHQSLSIGVHHDTDEECLKIAHSIRLVLSDLAERISLALNEQRELQSAISELMKFNSEAAKKAKAK